MQLLDSALGADGRVSHIVEFGAAPSVIREQAEELEPDLLVMRRRGGQLLADVSPVHAVTALALVAIYLLNSYALYFFSS